MSGIWIKQAGFCAIILAVSLGAQCITGPEPIERTDPLGITAVADQTPVFEGATVTLSATATGGTPPYAYRWDQNDGPDLALGETTTDSFTTDALTETGRYVFRVIGTDSTGATEEAFVVVEVGTVASTSVPALVVIGEPAALTAQLSTEVTGAAIEWTITSGGGGIADPTDLDTTITTEAAETVDLRLTVTIPTDGEMPQVATQSFEIVSVASLQPRVLVETTLGDFTLELNGTDAPNHTANLLLYVDDGFFDGLLFHRVACTRDESSGVCEPFVIQGGGFERVDDELLLKEPTRDPIESEASDAMTNGDIYSVALALTGGDPNSGTTQFFVNMQDNSFLDDQSFTAFAAVVVGTDVLDAIAAVDVADNSIITLPSGEAEVSLPVEDVIMTRVSRVAP